ncbi:HNH endonuclease [Streptomyces sp. NPDC102405]|uniref:HNH endonuclease n=1 Tax=Streptomyces sp. NPDC102405 TaxID=3366170 RepID=UPI0037F4CB84
MAVSKRLRYEILRRDSHTCRYCGASAPDVPLRVDHVTPVALGGTDEPSNLVTSCEPCNSGKSSATVDAAVVADVNEDALRWASAIKQAADDLRDQQKPKLAYRKVFEKAWTGWTREEGWKTVRMELPEGWKASLDAFYQAGLPKEVWPDIVEKAMTNPTVKVDNTFRYACGIGWRMVNDLHERARKIVGPQSPQGHQVGDQFAQAVVDLWAARWLSEHDEDAPEGPRSEFISGVLAHQDITHWEEPDRLVKAALVGAAERCTTMEECLAKLAAEERAEIVMEWAEAWMDFAGHGATLKDLPFSYDYATVQSQVDQIAATDLTLSRARRAAIMAAYHRATELHHGLKRDDLTSTGVTAWRQNATDVWSRSFWAAAGRWPSDDERAAFHRHTNRVLAESTELYISDLNAAVVAAGAYQDTDLSTCLPRRNSVFEAAASLPCLAA